MTDRNIIIACPFVAGIESSGMAQLKAEFETLTVKKVNIRDSLHLEPVGYDFSYKVYRAGTRYDGEHEGGEISLFDELEVSL